MDKAYELLNQLNIEANDFFIANYGKLYLEAKLKIINNSTGTLCGRCDGSPFYCPLDGVIYINEQILNKLDKNRPIGLHLILAHELGHHIQNQNGKEYQAQIDMQKGKSKFVCAKELELDADMIAGQLLSSLLTKKELDCCLEFYKSIKEDELHGTIEERMKCFSMGAFL